MTEESAPKAEIEAQAADWLARVHAPDVGDADLIALTAWLEASPDHVAAYDRAERLWARLDTISAAASGSAEVVDLGQRRAAKQETSRRASRGVRWGRWAALGGVAASIGLVFASGALLRSPPSAVTYQTAKGETREITLDDGTRLHLNSDTSLTVAMRTKERRVDLDHGEVSLTVAHNAAHPFSLRAGDARITDIGTQFNVLRHDGVVSVTVREGKVGVGPVSDDKPKQILSAGEQSVHAEGGRRYSRETVDPDTAFAWEDGRVVYHDRPLSEVASDLNRYFKKPLVVDEEIGQLKLTAIITLDSEASVVKRLEAFLPVEATTTAEDIRLRKRD